MSSENRVERYTKLAVKYVFIAFGIWFWFWVAGDDLDGASKVVIILLLMMSADLGNKIERLQSSIDDLKEEKSTSTNEGIVGPDGKRVGSADVD